MSIKAESLFPDQSFEIVYGSTTLFEKPVDMQDRLAFHVTFSSTHKPLLMVRARDFNQCRFWSKLRHSCPVITLRRHTGLYLVMALRQET